MDFDRMIEDLYFNRDEKSNKADFGRALIIGGSLSYPNAVTIASQFAELAGPGYIAVAVPRAIYPIIASRVSERIIYENLSTHDDDFLSENEGALDRILKYDSILFGNGIADSVQNHELLSYIVQNYFGDLIIDATGLRLLSENQSSCLAKKRPVSRILLTPHLGEAASLFGVTRDSREPDDYLDEALDYASRFDVSILLKGYRSILVTPEKKTFRSDYPPVAALARAGSGDALAGYICGLLAYGLHQNNLSSIVLFADQMIHLAAIEAQKRSSPGSVEISDIMTAMKNIISAVGDGLD